jgi:hypothetical protein
MIHATSRAASVASIHLGPINQLRRRAGLTALTLAEAEREFDVVNRSPIRKAVATRTTSNTGTADALWGGIITKLNASLSSSRTPIGARRASPAPASTHPTQRAVDWSEIASGLNEQAGLKTTVSGRAR